MRSLNSKILIHFYRWFQLGLLYANIFWNMRFDFLFPYICMFEFTLCMQKSGNLVDQTYLISLLLILKGRIMNYVDVDPSTGFHQVFSEHDFRQERTQLCIWWKFKEFYELLNLRWELPLRIIQEGKHVLKSEWVKENEACLAHVKF